MSLKAGLLGVFLVFGALTAVGAVEEKPMTNADVVAMVTAKMPESTIVLAIGAAKPAFDTSASALIDLSKRGVPTAIVEAMIRAASGGEIAGVAAVEHVSPEEISVDAGNGVEKMRYLTPDIRQAVRALGYGGVAQYAALHGSAAAMRLGSTEPKFTVAVPKNAQAQSYVTLVNLAVRRNGTREVMIGGGYMSYSSGINKDRVVATTDRVIDDQSRAPEGYELHEIAPVSALPPGEYAVVLYNSEVKVAGWFVSGRDSYFDFGIDR
jgi:hypothetical protein